MWKNATTAITQEFTTLVDLDTTGNSALHYAAAGGANYEHFNALIKAGVNPYHLNTNGQLFLHCLRPILKESDCEAFDQHLLTAFNLNLVNLLNHFRLSGAFRWRDNEGMTAVDALALQVNDIKATKQIFSAVRNAGHPLEVSPRFQKAPKSVKSAKWQQPSPVSDPSTPQQEDPFSKNVGDKIEQGQQRFKDLLHRAWAEPSYVDPETGDNALHALSRIQLRQVGSYMKMLSSIRAFARKDDLDLNLQNRDQESPLTSIVRHRPAQGMGSHETGATMSKYLDALLWKDPLQRLPNKINVNMRNRKGATALYYAAIRGRPDSVRSLIEAGANVNAKLRIDGHAVSILQATLSAKDRALERSPNDTLTIYLYDNVLSYLEHENALADPTIFDERRVSENSVKMMPGCI
ncbi:Ankyrin repeat-containing cofactor 2 [Hyphodiscus hymeniophilus]|uniref:Ankyrin repeat-containing cofactor 2 n=1 Tax=Hyphodiscus hymeniophilus TaxID=353542 RepID=A0A9P6SL06_9HELO|nr:Ankyrin repeat-containing cofactor 2 [Hyphodiscus hymeniophilus]